MPAATTPLGEVPDSRVRFASKRDLWINLLLHAGVAALAVTCVYRIGMGGGDTGIAIFCGIMALFNLWLLYGTEYFLDGRELVARSGPFAWTVELASIESVRPTRNPLSSPALSLERLRIEYRQGNRVCRILISPQDQDGFINALDAAAPQLAKTGTHELSLRSAAV